MPLSAPPLRVQAFLESLQSALQDASSNEVSKTFEHTVLCLLHQSAVYINDGLVDLLATQRLNPSEGPAFLEHLIQERNDIVQSLNLPIPSSCIAFARHLTHMPHVFRIDQGHVFFDIKAMYPVVLYGLAMVERRRCERLKAIFEQYPSASSLIERLQHTAEAERCTYALQPAA